MFKRQTDIAVQNEPQVQEPSRLEEILKSIDGLIFSIKMDNFQSLSAQKSGTSGKAFEYTAQEMMAKKNILFNLLPKDELYAITKRKSTNTAMSVPLN